MAKISGPLLDRIDLHIEVPAVPFKELSGSHGGTTSAVMRDQVMRPARFRRPAFCRSKTRQNAQMSTREIRQHCQLTDAGMNLLRSSIQEMGLSARATTRCSASPAPSPTSTAAPRSCPKHVNEAVNYRMLDRQFWS